MTLRHHHLLRLVRPACGPALLSSDPAGGVAETAEERRRAEAIAAE